MSVYPFTPWIGARAQLAFVMDGALRTFGVGQRLRELSVDRSYEAIYQIGSRVIQAIPFGRFNVTWRVESVLSELSILNLLFSCSGDTCTRSDSPIVFDMKVWYSSGGESNSAWTLPGSVVSDFSIEASTEGRGAGVSVTVGGFSKSVQVSNDVPGTIQMPGKVYTFAGASLSVGGQAVYARSVSLNIRNGAERLYAIGDDKPVAVYLGQWEVTATLTLPIYGNTISLINTLMQNANMGAFSLSLAGYGVNDASPSDTITFVSNEIQKITRIRPPITEIGLNTITVEVTLKDVYVQLGINPR